MTTSVYCLTKTDAHAVRIANRLKTSGFSPNDISILTPDRGGVRELGVENSTKVPEGAATGAGTGALLGGALGWMAGIGALAIPGVGPLIAAGPILGALTGLAVGGTVGGVSGALIGMGIPEYEAQQYESKLKEGNILMCVHASDSDEAARAREIFTEEKAESISTGSASAVAAR